MSDNSSPKDLLALTTEIVAAHVSNNTVGVADLPQLRDVDTAADAVAVACEAPRSRFAARARMLAAVLSPAGRGERAFAESALGETA